MSRSHYKKHSSVLSDISINMIFDKIRQFILFYFQVIRTRPVDALGCGFITGCAILTYIFGTFQILPIILEDFSTLTRLLAIATTTYLLFGVLANIAFIHYRNSSIKNKILTQPVVRPPPSTPVTNGNGEQGSDYELKERTKYIGQHFLARPFGEEGWHICATCEVFVPPRAWHCNMCKTCILRRDHHCIIVMGCIGEENHCNFLGLLFYLSVGSTTASVIYFSFRIYHESQVWWILIVKAFVPFYTILFEFSVLNLLSGVVLLGQFCAWFVLLYYLHLASKGETIADSSRGVPRVEPGLKKYKMDNLTKFLGPNPFYRILWPFHPVILRSLEAPNPDECDDRKGV